MVHFRQPKIFAFLLVLLLVDFRGKKLAILVSRYYLNQKLREFTNPFPIPQVQNSLPFQSAVRLLDEAQEFGVAPEDLVLAVEKGLEMTHPEMMSDDRAAIVRTLFEDPSVQDEIAFAHLSETGISGSQLERDA